MHTAETAAVSAAVESVPAPSPTAATAMAPAVQAVLALQRTVGNRGVLRVLARREGPEDFGATVDAALGARPAEEARMSAAIRSRAHARLMLPGDVAEAASLASLAEPAGDVAIPNGARKLLEGVARLGAALSGSQAEYARAPEDAVCGLLSFVRGDPADHDGRVTVKTDGLLEVEVTKRTQPKAAKGKPLPPMVVTRTSTVYDLEGTKIKLKEGQVAADIFLAHATSAAESAAQRTALDAIGASTTPVTGSVGSDHWTLAQLEAEADPGVYVQRGYVGKKGEERKSDLTVMVQAAFDALRAEFDAFAAPLVADQETPPTHDQLVEQFSDQLQPALKSATDAAQAALTTAQEAETAATAAVTEADAALVAAQAVKGATAPERATALQGVKDAQATRKKAAALAKSTAATTKKRTKQLAEVSAVRTKYRTHIGYILNTSNTTEKLAAATVGSLCNVLSYYFYGRAVGVVSTGFSSYYLGEIKAGSITRQEGSSGIYMGTGSSNWAAQRGLERTNEEESVKSVPLSNPSRRAELRELLASDINVAVSHQDLNNTPPVKAHHFLLIVKDAQGAWRNLDHTSGAYQRRGGLTDWGRVFRIDVDEAMIKAARAKLSGAPALP